MPINDELFDQLFGGTTVAPTVPADVQKSSINVDYFDSLFGGDHSDVQQNKLEAAPLSLTTADGLVIPPRQLDPATRYAPEDPEAPAPIMPEPGRTAEVLGAGAQIVERTLKQFWNKGVVDPAHILGASDSPALLKAVEVQQARMKGRARYPEQWYDDELKEIMWQLGQRPEARDDPDLKGITEVLGIGEDENPFPKFKIPPGQNAGDYIADTVAGIGSFVAQLVFLRKILPGAPSQVIWEIQNIAAGGKPGRGAAINTALKGISEIPSVGKLGKATKVAAGGGLFGGLAYKEGGDWVDVAVSTGIGMGFQGWDIHKQNQWLKGFRSHLKKAEYAKAQRAITEGQRQAKQAYEQDIAGGMKPQEAQAKYQRASRDATRIGEWQLRDIEPKIDKAMDIVAKKLHHGKMKGREAQLAEQIVVEGLTPEAAKKVAKLPGKRKPRDELSKKTRVGYEERLFALKPKRQPGRMDTVVVVRSAKGEEIGYYPAGTTFSRLPEGATVTTEPMGGLPSTVPIVPPRRGKVAEKKEKAPELPGPAKAAEAKPGEEYDSAEKGRMVRREPQGEEPGRPVQVEKEGAEAAEAGGILQEQGEVAERKSDMGIGALPGMAADVREIAVKEIQQAVGERAEYAEVDPEYIGDSAINYWTNIRDKYNKLITDIENPDLSQAERRKADDEQVALTQELFEQLEKEPLTKAEEQRIVKERVEHEPEEDETRPRGVRTAGRGALEGIPPETLPTPEKEREPVRRAVRGGEAGGRVHGEGADAPGVQYGDRLHSSGGSSTEDVDTSTRRGPTARRTREDAAERDYRITEADQIGKGGLKTKYRNNIAAIKLLKQIESENRPATPQEQAVLVQYVGWGGLPQVFNEYGGDEDWLKKNKQLKALLAEEEYTAAKASTPNAHYTTFETISAIWEGLIALGFKGGRINEPSMGVGHFYGLMPDSIAANSKLFGVELDEISGRIAKQLYQSADIQVTGFEKTKYPDNYFDLFISNVPFGNYQVYDEEMRKLKFQIHDFFFAKALKKTRPGGLVVFITSKGTLDKTDSAIRSYIAKEADLIGAIRLPNTAFKEIANTEVVTDIIVLQKRDPKKFPAGETFQKLGQIKKAGEVFVVNEYFARHKDHLLGKLAYSGRMYRAGEMTLEPKRGLKIGEEVLRIMRGFKFSEDIDAEQRERNEERHEAGYSAPAPDYVKENAYVVDGGRLLQNKKGTLVPVDVPKSTARRMKAFVQLRDTLRDLLHKQLSEDQSDKQIEAARKELGILYRKVVKQYEPLSTTYNQRVFRNDPDLPMLLSLETFDREKNVVVKLADIFTKRTQFPYKVVVHAETADEALVASLAEKGAVDLAYMGVLLDESEQEVAAELAGKIYMDPAATKWVSADMYLSGNVRRKLQEAREAYEQTKDPRWKHNTEALERVQPEDISPVDIDVRLGATWVDEEDYLEFYRHLVGEKAYGVSFHKVASEGTWIAEGRGVWGTAETATWGTDWFGALKLMTMAMNQKEPTAFEKGPSGQKVVNQDQTVAARVKQQQIKDEFKKWLWDSAPRATRLARKYNDQYNNTVFPVWDGSHLKLPGKVDDSIIRLRPHQINGVWRYLTTGNVLLAHQVGAGKTYTGVAIAMEARRLGLAKKPIFVVPNHLVTQWRDSWMKLYPSATILFATKEDFQPKNRQTLMNKIATGDWDGIIVPQTSFEKIPMHPDIVRAFFQEQLTALEDEMRQASRDHNRNLTKELEKAKKRMAASLERQEAKWKKDVGPYFNEMGIDMLFVDESQGFKNLYFRTQMTRVAGVQQSFVQKSFDMELKTRYINKVTGGQGLIFATGTPITNSICEMFTIQRYMQPDVLKEAGLEAFDFWAQNFGETVTSVEVAPDGSGFRVHTRFAKFTNLPELMQMFRSTTDIQTAEMLKLEVPKVKNGKAAVIQAPESDMLKGYVATLVQRAEDIRRRKVDPKDDNMLKVTMDGRNVALDLRLRIPGAPDSPTSKVNMLVDKVYEIWERTAKQKATQVVWCDLSTPKPGQWSIYDDVKGKLIKKGVPAAEIAFIHDVKNQKNLATFYQNVNDGKIRVVMASTFKMGTGANVQERLIAAHHLDAPWRPADIEQRDGRIIRPGNSYDEVELYRYVTKGSFDAYMWQTLETKAKFIAQVMTGETTAREAEDIGDTILSYAEVKALASGNPKVMEAVGLESEIKQLQSLEKAHRNQQFGFQKKLAELPQEIEFQEKRNKATKADVEKYRAAKQKAGKELDFRFAGTHYTKRKDAGEALLTIVDGLNKLVTEDVKVGKAYGFALEAKWVMGLEGTRSGWWRITIVGDWRYEVDLEESAIGNITRILNTFEAIEEKAKASEALAGRMRKDQAEITAKQDEPFEQAKDLKEKKARLTALQQEIGLDKKDEGPIGEGEEPTTDVPSPLGGFVGGRPSAPATAKVSAIVKEDLSTGSTQADSFLRRTKGFTSSGRPGILRGVVRRVADVFREFHYLPDLPKQAEYADVRESFRHTEEIKKRALDDAVKKMRWALKPIEGIKWETKSRMKALEMKIIADDLAEDIERDVELPVDLTEADVRTMKLRADELYEKYPSVREAYDRVREETQAIGDMLVSEGMLDEERAREFYFPHRVIKYLREGDGFFGIPTRKPAQYKKGYLKQRKGGYDYSTDIMERLVEHWAQVRRDIDYSRFLTKVLKEEQANYFKKEHPDWKRFTRTEEGKKVRNLIPEGYKEVTVLPGRFYYATHGVSEDMAKAIVAQNIEAIEEMIGEGAAQAVRRVLAVGRKRSFIVREPIARQIHNMPTMPISTAPAYLAVKGFHTFVKTQILFNPLYTVPFHVQNFIGDASKVFVALPSALEPKYLTNYWEEIIAAHRGEKSERFDQAQRYGVIGSGWIGVDIPQLKTIMPEIARAEISGPGKYLANKAKTLWNLVRRVGSGREDWLRYALFDRLMDLQDAGEDLIKYAIKDSAMLSGITDKTTLAAKVARDIAGDYSAIGKTGRMLSDIAVPFYRWMHLNLPWWPRMVKEYAKKGQYGTLIYAILAASAPYILAVLWNYSSEERRNFEKTLPYWKRWNFHINSLHGKKMYYVQLPLDDVLNFIGIPEDILDIMRYQQGKINAPELVKRIAINSTYEPGMSVVNSIGGLPAVVRDAIGWQTYPDFKDYRITDWKRKGLNVGSDVFGAPGQLGKQLYREGVRIDPATGDIVLGLKTKDTLNRAWMGIRPYSLDIERTKELKRKSVYKQTTITREKETGKLITRRKGRAHKGKQRLVDSLNMQLEGAK